MKKTPLINSEISAVIAQLGHMDTIVIGDMGLPIPDHVLRIDLAVRMGLPSFQDVLENYSYRNARRIFCYCRGSKC